MSQASQLPFTPDLPPFPTIALASSRASRLPQLPPIALLSVTQHCACDMVFAPKQLEVASCRLYAGIIWSLLPQCWILAESARALSAPWPVGCHSAVTRCSARGKATGEPATSSEDSLALTRSSDIFVFMSLSTFGFFPSSWGKIAAVSNILSDPRSLVVNKKSVSAEDAVETRLG